MPMRSDAGGGLRVAVIGEPTGWHVGRLLAALAARGHRGTAIRWTDIAAEVAAAPTSGDSTASGTAGERFLPPLLESADLVIVRGMPGGGLEEVVFRMDLLGRLAARGVPVFNSPRGLEIAIDKYLSLARMAAAGLPVPRTVVAQSPPAIEAAWQALGRDCVAKPLFGSRGRGMVRISDRESLATLLSTAAAAQPAGAVAYLQEFVPHDGWDVRILIVGNNTFSIRRFAAPGEWRTNVSLGGRPEAFEPPPAWVDLARAAARAVETEIAGVDLLPGPDGRVVVLEVNAVPGWRGLESATGFDVSNAVVEYLENRLANG
jgi:ribosomal protein S6--L-glutamate ligase